MYLDGNKNITVLNYFSEINKLVNDPVILYSVKTFRYEKSDNTYASNQHYQIYSGLPYTIDEGYDKHFSDFFHPLKDSLLKQIKYVAESEKPAQIGFIFYGPPGTGKSRFAYCLAMALLRHLISVDVSSLNKSSLQQIFKKPCVNEQFTTPDKVIYIFDEFDITINDLNKVEINDEYSETLGRKALLSYEKKLKFYEEHQHDTDCDGKLAHSEPVPPTVHKSRLLDTNKVTIRSLLEIINGPMPLSGAIFIATTNNFEEIKQICPALFRTGRLTPIYFGYCENETLQSMSNHYYNKELNLPNNIISTISSADIIDHIIKHKLEKDYQFEDFEKYILKNIKTKN